MANQTIPVTSGEHFAVTATIDNVTGEIQRVDWTIDPGSGTLKVTITQTGKAPIVQNLTSSGFTNVPKGYMMQPGARGGWVWAGGPNGANYTDEWIPA